MNCDWKISMRRKPTIGLVVPFPTNDVPVEGPMMYPDVDFVSRGVGVTSLTPAGYEAAIERVIPAAEELAKQGVDAIMVIGMSLTFFRGFDFHEQLLQRLRAATGVPVSTMSAAMVDGLRSVGARRIAVSTAYADEVNGLLTTFLTASGFEVLALKGFGIVRFGAAGGKSEADIIALGKQSCAEAPDAEGLLIACGGLRTLGVAQPLERDCGVPVVSSTQAAFWSALRLAGESGFVSGFGRLLQQSTVPAAAQV
jgi:arylmalonate decarboxylase